jgi:hypothetical protein
MNAMTAAHRTLPWLVVRVTNVKGQSALLKITDRGPLWTDTSSTRLLRRCQSAGYLAAGRGPRQTRSAAHSVAIATGGRWAVQIGSFGKQKEASDMAAHLARRYQTAKVSKFSPRRRLVGPRSRPR